MSRMPSSRLDARTTIGRALRGRPVWHGNVANRRHWARPVRNTVGGMLVCERHRRHPYQGIRLTALGVWEPTDVVLWSYRHAVKWLW